MNEWRNDSGDEIVGADRLQDREREGGDKEIWPCHSPPKLIADTSTRATKTELL